MNTLSRKYETGVVAILTLVIGVMAFEQGGINFLLPYIKPALNLKNTQVGQLVSAYWVAFAFSSLLGSILLDEVGRRFSSIGMYGFACLFAAFLSRISASVTHSFRCSTSAKERCLPKE